MKKEPYNQYEPYTDVIYRLIGYDMNYPHIESYPRFWIHQSEESIHRTYNDAYERMQCIVKNHVRHNSKWVCFFISEVPVGVCSFIKSDGQKIWSFTGQGEFVAHRDVSSLEDINGNRQIFWGREPDECRFKVGDLVEVFNVSYVTLGIIWDLPINFEFVQKRLPKEKPDEPMSFHMDESDDCYVIVTMEDEYPDHMDVIDCFPVGSLYLDESVISKLRERFASFTEENVKTLWNQMN